MRLIAALTDELSIRHYLTGIGLAAVLPPIAPTQPQLKQRSTSPPESSPESIGRIEPLCPAGCYEAHG